MEAGLLDRLAAAPAQAALFAGAEPITAGAIRAAAERAARALRGGAGPVHLFTESAALCVAGLLAAHAANRAAIILPHAQPGYLDQIGATRSSFLTDCGPEPSLAFAGADAIFAPRAPDMGLDFYTSGSTGEPTRVAKRLSQLEAEGRYWVQLFSPRIKAVAATVSHQHIYGFIFRVIAPILGGWLSQDRADFVWESFAARLNGAVLGVSSPAHLSRLPPDLRLPAPPGDIISSGQALPLAQSHAARAALGVAPLEILGSTETGGVAQRRQGQEAGEAWTPLKGVSVTASASGTLLVSSPFAGDAPVTMGDQVEILADGRFCLLGRADRVVKIEGKRVSLSAVEASLRAMPEVEDVAITPLERRSGKVRLAALVSPSEAGREKLAALGAFRLGRRLREALARAHDGAEKPSHWRFVSEIPRNSQGKRAASALAAIFDEPSMMERLGAQAQALSTEKAVISFTLAPDLPWFSGHFPDLPILPGVAQVHIVARLAEELWAAAPQNPSLRRLKFRRIMEPGDEAIVTLTRDAAKGRIEFSFYARGQLASSGVLGGD